ncbi:MAG: AAA domain-containing protein [Crocinitomicaceae bacterium]|nr:AAA domain-containing protein [Crocinitomicaceae bacterium]
MSENVKNSISELLKESSQFNTNDVLVNANDENRKLFFCGDQLNFPISDFPKSIVKEADKSRKESGVNTLCRAEGLVHLSLNGKEVQTPILLSPLEFTKDKIKQEIRFKVLDEDVFLNPFLLKEVPDLNEVIQLEDTTIDLTSISTFLSEKGLTIEKDSTHIIGNFHHHRYQVIKELEDLLESEKLSSNVSTLFGFDSMTNSEQLSLPADNLFSADTDHEKVFAQIELGNTVVQGPPGTGKSQVLTNLVGKLLAAHQTTIFVSEKRVALEVIQKKLSAFGLDKLCFIATSDHLSHSFLQALKSTWDYFESYEIQPVNNLRLSEQYSSNLQMTLDLLAQEKLIGGISFHAFRELSSSQNLSTFSYSSQVTELDKYLKIKPIVEKVYSLDLNTVLGHLKRHRLEDDNFVRIDEKIDQWIESLNALSKVFSFTTWNEFNSIIKDAAHCQVYENDLYKTYSDIFRPNSKANKRFLSLRKKFLQAKVELEQINSNRSHWKTSPSETETNSLIQTLGNGSFFSKKKAKKRWEGISHLPVSKANEALSNHLEELAKINNYSQIIIKFCELGMENPEIEVSLLYQTLGVFGEDQWKILEELSPELRVKMTDHHAELNELHHALKSHFNLTEETDLHKLVDSLKKQLTQLISHRDEILKLDENALISFSRNSDFSSYEGELFASHWARFKEQFPAFSSFSMNDIQEKISNILSAQKSESKLFAQTIENKVCSSFHEYHEILTTPARKLNDEQKELKARLRKGKSILVKEFSKTRSHPSLRELYNSEAREWIQLLQPIWLSNPTQLAKCFPMEQGLFDVAIFDEASQIPLQNALGTLQRSNRIVVAGDEHQMGPSAYFKAGASEELDLLHQANYHWQKVSLQHHYRSVHPDLIAFSNKHFYNNLLKAYPAKTDMTPLRHHLVEEGRFIDRQNIPEAKQLAEAIEKTLPESGSIGIVAFSEEQLNCIWNQFSVKTQQIITEKLENNQGFFKALENVQGDECDHLFISFGYGPNAEGEFHMRFGPMSTVSGRKRLNVLLTRAIHSIDFFCSVHSSNFKLSDNESINLLRQWIAFSESYVNTSELTFPFGLQPIIDGNILTFNRIQEVLPSSSEIVTLHSILENRGWVVAYN